MKPRYAEIFAGAGGLSLGLERAGFECAWHAELADFPRRILKHRWPDTPLLGDVVTLDGRELVREYGPIDVLSGGSPCQDLSVAGKRAGLAGARSGLFHQQMRLWDETEAPVCLWENVDGARSSNNGRDLAAVLSAFVGASVAVPRDGWSSAGVVAGTTGIAAWRILDAQFFGVPQRRRRIFVIGSRAARIDPSEILLECESLLRHSAPSRRPGNHAAKTTRAGAPKTCDHLAVIAFDEAQVTHPENRSNPQPGDPCSTLADPARLIAVFNETGHERWMEESVVGSLNAHEHKDAHTAIVGTLSGNYKRDRGDRSDKSKLISTYGIPRRLLPLECERLMGWPDGWTDVPDEKGRPAKDGPRYKAIGNGVASPVVQWIGQRLYPLLTKE